MSGGQRNPIGKRRLSRATAFEAQGVLLVLACVRPLVGAGGAAFRINQYMVGVE